MRRNGQLSVTVRTGQGPLFRVSVPCEGGAHGTCPGAALRENGHGTCTGALVDLLALPHALIEFMLGLFEEEE